MYDDPQRMYDELAPDQWLSLSEASSILGVHASTLRRWADSGRVPCQRTPGGHRRFNRRRLMQLLEGGVHDAASKSEPDMASDQPWHPTFVQAGLLSELREVGQRLTGIAMQFLLRDDDDERYIGEARLLGNHYGVRSQQGGVDLLQATQAFLFYRSAYISVVGQMRAADPTASIRLFARYETLMGEVLLSLIASYEQASSA